MGFVFPIRNSLFISRESAWRGGYEEVIRHALRGRVWGLSRGPLLPSVLQMTMNQVEETHNDYSLMQSRMARERWEEQIRNKAMQMSTDAANSCHSKPINTTGWEHTIEKSVLHQAEGPNGPRELQG